MEATAAVGLVVGSFVGVVVARWQHTLPLPSAVCQRLLDSLSLAPSPAWRRQ